MQKFLDKITKNSLFVIVIAMIGVAGFLLGFHIKKPQIQFAINSTSVLLDGKADVPALKILLDSVNLRDRNENIVIYNIQFENIGDANLTKNLYIDGYHPTLKISNGRILGKPKVFWQKDSNYANIITDAIIYTDSTIVLPEIVLDKGDGFALEVMAIFKDSQPLNISSLGKISGQDKIEVIHSNFQSEKPFYLQIIQGSIYINVVRFFLFGIIFGIIFIFLLLKYFSIKNKMDRRSMRRKRKTEIAEFEKTYRIAEGDKFIIDKYINGDFGIIQIMEGVFQMSEKELTNIYNGKFPKQNKDEISIAYDHYQSLIREYINNGFLELNNNQIIVRKSTKETVQKLVEFVDNKKK